LPTPDGPVMTKTLDIRLRILTKPAVG
jgi:hypothetical protein